MKCELCAADIPEQSEECPSCSSLEARSKIQDLLVDTIEFLSRKFEKSEDEGEAYFLLGNFYRLSGSYDDAVASYERALENAAAHPKYYHALGTALAAKGDFQACVEAMKCAVSLAPNYPDYHNDLGAAYFKDGKYDEAMKAFEEAVRLNPQYANAHNNLSLVFRKKKDFEAAEKEVKKAVELDPAHAIGGYALGLSYYSGGMFSQLRAGSLQIDARSMGDIFFMHELYPHAIEYYARAVALHPRYADNQYALGAAYAASGDKQKAKTAFQKALELNPNYGKAREALNQLDKEGKK